MHKEIFDETMKQIFEDAMTYYESQFESRLWWKSYLPKETFLKRILDFVKKNG